MYQMISAKASKIDLIEQYGAMTLKKIVHENYPSIGDLQRTHGKEPVQTAIAVIVADLNQSFGGDLSKDEIIEVVAELRAGITVNLSLEDIYLACRTIKLNESYKLKVSTLLKAFTQHFNEKSNLVANNNYNAHLATKFKSEPLSTRKDKDFESFKAIYLAKNNS